MNIAIISGSNVGSSGKNSISLRTGEHLRDKIKAFNKDCDIHLVDLRDYRLTPCSMCEGCAETQHCVGDADFNKLRPIIQQADELIFVCPHYAPIPSKLVILLEKLSEMNYLQFCSGQKGPDPVRGKKAGIIAHGGMMEGYTRIYKENVLVPLSNVLESMGMKVVNKWSEQPLCFGVKDFEKTEDKIPYDIIHDMDMLHASLESFMELYKRA